MNPTLYLLNSPPFYVSPLVSEDVRAVVSDKKTRYALIEAASCQAVRYFDIVHITDEGIRSTGKIGPSI